MAITYVDDLLALNLLSALWRVIFKLHKAASYSAGEVMSAPLQNHSLNGSIECKEQPLGTLSSGGILGV